MSKHLQFDKIIRVCDGKVELYNCEKVSIFAPFLWKFL